MTRAQAITWGVDMIEECPKKMFLASVPLLSPNDNLRLVIGCVEGRAYFHIDGISSSTFVVCEGQEVEVNLSATGITIVAASP